ncbi:MAG: ABC transporter permease [Bacteroidales bacterium]|nr:ABC transporter permease [Bacteroidales bacterium]
MHTLLASIRKEFLILIRDWAGLGLIFLMPVALVMVMSLIQDVTYKKLDETSLPILFLDKDQDELGIQVKQGLEQTGFFKVSTSVGGQPLDESTILKLVAKGDFQMGVVIIEGSTDAIRARGQYFVQQTLLGDDEDALPPENMDKARIVIYFDPAIKNSFKITVRTTLENFTSKIEAGILFRALSEEVAQYLPEPPAPVTDPGEGITYQEIYATNEHTEIVPNSVQHNVPAWTIFAMFFIIIPLTGNIIKERENGLATRLRIMPGNKLQALGAKIFIYMMVGLVQFSLMFMFGKFVLPYFGLPSLLLGPEKIALLLMALATALAATGYSVLVGSVASTHDQAAVFGTVSVIILAAIGGIWVPVFMMPDLMQKASIISPLNWSLSGFYDILLRGGGIREISDNLFLLLAFFILTLAAAIWASEKGVRR